MYVAFSWHDVHPTPIGSCCQQEIFDSSFFFYFSFIRLFVVICYYYFGFDFPSSPYISNSNHTKTSCWELTIIAIWLSFFMLGLSNCHVLWFYVSKWNRSQNKYLKRFIFVGIGSRLFMPIWSDVMSAHVNSWQLFWIWIKWREKKIRNKPHNFT